VGFVGLLRCEKGAWELLLNRLESVTILDSWRQAYLVDLVATSVGRRLF
jgi:hypothetical protein